MTLKRYRMEIVLIDTVVHIQPRHDAGTGEWYAASEVDHVAKELSDANIQVRGGLILDAMVKEAMIKDLQLRVAAAIKALKKIEQLAINSGMDGIAELAENAYLKSEKE